MGHTITEEQIKSAPSDMLHRMWADAGWSSEVLGDVGQYPDRQIVSLAEWIFDELVERKEAIEHYPLLESIIGVVEIEED